MTVTASSNYNALLQLIGASGAVVNEGIGSPEGSVVGNIGNYYARLDGGTSSAAPAYVKFANPGLNTGWVPLSPRLEDNLSAQVDGILTSFLFTGGGKAFHNPTFQIVIEVALNGQKLVLGIGADYTVSESGGAGTGFDTIGFTFTPKATGRLIVSYLPI